MSPTRRGHGEGSVSQRPDGRWLAHLDLGRAPDGTRRRKFVYAATHAEVVRKLKEIGRRAAAGQLLTTATPTVATFLEDWFATKKATWRPSTRRSYRGAIDLYLLPAFGSLKLDQLTPLIVQRWLTTHANAHGARRRITLAHAALRAALSHAQRLQLVAINAGKLVSVPQPDARPLVPFTVDHATAFLAAAGRHRLGALFTVALACGLRLGEACGLRWEDLDLETGELRVRQQLVLLSVAEARAQGTGRLVLQDVKTVKSRRTLELPAVCVDRLRTHHTRQLEERLKVGGAWQDCGLVFVTVARKRGTYARGGPLHPRNVTRAYHTVLQAAGLPPLNFHGLRHSAASLLLAQGVPLIDVSQLLGHSELRLTADLYAHLQTETAKKAARHMDAIFRGRT